jgi:PPOX class probable F420-dependent enzyme
VPPRGLEALGRSASGALRSFQVTAGVEGLDDEPSPVVDDERRLERGVEDVRHGTGVGAEVGGGSVHGMDLPPELLTLLRDRATCYIATTMPDGSPQLTQTWVDTDGTNIVINTVDGFQKVRNVERDARVAVTVADPQNPSRYFSVRGRVVSSTPEGGVESIEALAQKYLGGPYPWFGGRDQTRVVMTIAADRIHAVG